LNGNGIPNMVTKLDSGLERVETEDLSANFAVSGTTINHARNLLHNIIVKIYA